MYIRLGSQAQHLDFDLEISNSREAICILDKKVHEAKMPAYNMMQDLNGTLGLPVLEGGKAGACFNYKCEEKCDLNGQ
jgi:hypothetical protein